MSSPLPSPHVVRRGEGLPLLIVHGYGVDHTMMLELDDAFADQPWQRLYIDLPGFGRTEALPPPGGLPEYANWLDQAASTLIGDTPFAVAGHSMGGLLAADLLHRRREQCRGIALLAPPVLPDRDERTLPDAGVVHDDPELMASLEEEDREVYEPVSVVRSPSNWERFRRAALPGIRAVDPDATDRLDERYHLDGCVTDYLADYDRPVMMVTGKQDAVVGYEDQWELSRRLIRCTFAALDRSGHNVHLDQPRVVRALLAEWGALASGIEDPGESASRDTRGGP
ncbi:alpha/beta fold hydrolase [Janibacter sp. GXQ6167]|uniref:alpha/beta fold hydrolase n=1 Tax=Janibacter sp. GXQ6167 TaxID=3240791 RepID=UPI0035256FC0